MGAGEYSNGMAKPYHIQGQSGKRVRRLRHHGLQSKREVFLISTLHIGTLTCRETFRLHYAKQQLRKGQAACCNLIPDLSPTPFDTHARFDYFCHTFNSSLGRIAYPSAVNCCTTRSPLKRRKSPDPSQSKKQIGRVLNSPYHSLQTEKSKDACDDSVVRRNAD